MERMIVKHVTGSKANQVEEFSLSHHQNILLGREANATVKYDPDRDDLVGREHAKISVDPNDSNGFIIEDLNSRNGTFVNKKRISGTVKIYPGDSVQLGPGGPEFVFDVEPRPVGATKQTRIAEIKSPETRVATPVTPTPATPVMPTPANMGKTSVGKATVERMINQSVTETRTEERGKFAKIGVAVAALGLLLIGGVAFGAYWYSNRNTQAMKQEIANKSEEISKLENQASNLQKTIETDKSSAPKAASDIADKFSKSVVMIETAWHLIHPIRKSQVYHLFVPTQALAKMGVKINTTAQAVPIYVQTNDGKSYEPVLVEDKGQFNEPIGSVHSGTGFFVSSDGFILTNRHVAATWKTSYQFPYDIPGVVLASDYKQIIGADAPPPTNWVPENSKSQGGILGAMNIKVSSPADYKGVNDSLEVVQAGKDRRVTATLTEASDRHDVALIKVDSPGELTKVELFDNYDTLKKGEEVIVMGYPAMTPKKFEVVKSQDMFNDKAKIKDIANPTVTVTSVSNIMRSESKDNDKQVISEIGDVIQLATGSTGAGNSGGPVFDTQGRVIGIFFAGTDKDAIRWAIPIRYGKELME